MAAPRFATPNLQAFAERAWRFDNHFVGSLPCMPARREIFAGFMTPCSGGHGARWSRSTCGCRSCSSGGLCHSDRDRPLSLLGGVGERLHPGLPDRRVHPRPRAGFLEAAGCPTRTCPNGSAISRVAARVAGAAIFPTSRSSSDDGDFFPAKVMTAAPIGSASARTPIRSSCRSESSTCTNRSIARALCLALWRRLGAGPLHPVAALPGCREPGRIHGAGHARRNRPSCGRNMRAKIDDDGPLVRQAAANAGRAGPVGRHRRHRHHRPRARPRRALRLRQAVPALRQPRQYSHADLAPRSAGPRPLARRADQTWTSSPPSSTSQARSRRPHHSRSILPMLSGRARGVRR